MVKVASTYGNVCVAGLNSYEVKNRVNYVRNKSTGNADYLRMIEQPILSQLSNEDTRFFLQFNIYRKIENDMVRITGWSNPDLSALLKNNRIDVFVDGTFKCVPHPYYQCVVIMVYDMATDYYVPVFFCFDNKQITKDL